MDLNEMTRKDFEAFPSRKWDEDIGDFDSLIILPLKRKHDSGFRCMDFVAVKAGIPLCRLSGCSDVIHLNGMDFSIDCLAKSGLLRIFGRKSLSAGDALSSFELYG